jgi:TasA anchoring/assembly protein
MILLKAALVWYLIIFTASYLTTDTAAVFTAKHKTENTITIGDWVVPDDSVLAFINNGNQNIKTCDQSVDLKVMLKNTGGDMQKASTYEVYYAVNGNPEKQGTKIKLSKGKGNIQALESGKTAELVHTTNKPGTYVFAARQTNNELKDDVIWSKWIKVHCPSDGKKEIKEKPGKDEAKATKEPKEENDEPVVEYSPSKEVKQKKEEQPLTDKSDTDAENVDKQEQKKVKKDDQEINKKNATDEKEKQNEAEKEKSMEENEKQQETEAKSEEEKDGEKE